MDLLSTAGVNVINAPKIRNNTIAVPIVGREIIKQGAIQKRLMFKTDMKMKQRDKDHELLLQRSNNYLGNNRKYRILVSQYLKN